MPDHPPHQKLLGRLTLETECGVFLGETRIRLLEAIERHGSISQAARSLPLSYKAAWDTLDAMNNLADEPLVERVAGGSHGGGTTLTPYGRRMVAFYRAMEQNYQEVLEGTARSLGAEGEPDFAHFRRLLRRMSMKASARNQFVGPVTALVDNGINVEVRLRFDADNELAVNITRESAGHLALKIGDEVHAFVKAPAVVLARERTSSAVEGSAFRGTISRIVTDESASEVCLLLPGGRSIVSVVDNAVLRREGLAEGIDAIAVIPPSSAMLVSFD